MRTRKQTERRSRYNEQLRGAPFVPPGQSGVVGGHGGEILTNGKNPARKHDDRGDQTVFKLVFSSSIIPSYSFLSYSIVIYFFFFFGFAIASDLVGPGGALGGHDR